MSFESQLVAISGDGTKRNLRERLLRLEQQVLKLADFRTEADLLESRSLELLQVRVPELQQGRHRQVERRKSDPQLE